MMKKRAWEGSKRAQKARSRTCVTLARDRAAAARNYANQARRAGWKR